MLLTCAEAAGLPTPNCHPHMLKHTLASHLVAGNVNLALVRQCLGPFEKLGLLQSNDLRTNDRTG